MSGSDFLNEMSFNEPYINHKAAMHTSPWYTQSQTFSPRRLKDLFRWCEFLYFNSAHIYAALRKFGEYPITTITYETENKALKEKHKYLLEKSVRAREILIAMTLDKYVYGNAFISMYQPFIRYLKCPSCSTLTNIQNLDYKFNYRKLTFAYFCANCSKQVVADEEHVEDRKLTLGKKINFIRWDPKLMDIDFNEVNDYSVYYYTIPRNMVLRVQNGHKTLIDSLPWGFLKAIQNNRQFRFNEGAIFHMKMVGPAGVGKQWGLPPLLTTLPMFYYTQVLRKANEAIALDHTVPFRVIHPAQSSNVADPVSTISLQEWKDRMKDEMRQWRRDPLHIMFAPIPVGVTQIGGQGRALLTLGEVQEAEKGIVAALGIPMEFLYGGLTQSGMEATLRLIENQLATHIGDIKDLLQWIDDSCAKFLGWQKIEVDMVPFKMVDDTVKKGMILQLYSMGQQTGTKIISDTTMAELNDIDLVKEEDRIRQETLDSVRRQQELQIEIQKLQNNSKIQSQQQAVSGTPYNQQEVIAKADEIVQQLLQMDYGARKSQLHSLQVEDYILYSVVVQRLESANTGQQGQMTAEAGA